jgi:hypothetical protein
MKIETKVYGRFFDVKHSQLSSALKEFLTKDDLILRSKMSGEEMYYSDDLIDLYITDEPDDLFIMNGTFQSDLKTAKHYFSEWHSVFLNSGIKCSFELVIENSEGKEIDSLEIP